MLAQQTAPVSAQTLHFDLAHVGPDQEFTLSIGLREYPLARHTDSTITLAKANSPFYHHVPDRNLTHYLNLELPEEFLGLFTVTRKVEVDGRLADQPVAMGIHIPEVSFAKFLANHPDPNALLAFPPKLEQYGVNAAMYTGALAGGHDPLKLILDGFTFKEARETAVALLYKHPGLMHLNGGSEYPAWIYKNLLEPNPGLTSLAYAIYQKQERWCETLVARDKDGNPYMNPDAPNEPLYTQKLHPDVATAVASPLNWALKKAQDAPKLEGQLWSVQYGLTSQAYDARPVYPGEATDAAEVTAGGVKWGVKNQTPFWGLSVDPPTFDPRTNRLAVTGYNRLARHLSAYVEFLNASGKRIALTEEQWQGVLDDIFRKILPREFFQLFEPRPETRFLNYISPVTTVCGVPIGSLLPDPSRFSFPIARDDIYAVRVVWGGPGIVTEDPLDPGGVYAAIGALLTLILDVLVPVVFLIVGSSNLTNKIITELMKDKELFKDIVVIGLMLVTGKILYDLNKGRNAVNAILPWIGMVLPKLLITKLGPYILAKLGEGAIGKALGKILPGSDVAMTIFSVSTTTAGLLEVLASILVAPSVIRTDFMRSLDLTVRLHPDPEDRHFPDLATSYRVAVMYDTDVTVPVCDLTYKLEGPTRSKPFTVTLKNIPAAGNLRVHTFFYAENGWQAGQGQSAWVKATGDENAQLTVEATVKTNEVPLTIRTIYKHKQQIAFEGGRHIWRAGEAPAATRHTVSPDPQRTINVLKGNITLARLPATLGYSWQARGLNLPKDRPGNPPTNEYMYTAQSLSLLDEPELSYWHPGLGYSLPAAINFDAASPEDVTGRNFFLDPGKGTYDPEKNPEGGFHLRRMLLRANQPPVIDFTQSWGRFNTPVDRFIVHPQGYALGINFAASKLEILKLYAQPMKDAEAPFAAMASGEGFRDGLMNGPGSIGITLDGRVLVLEERNNRVQAFDIFGNPVKSFKGTAGPQTWFALKDPKEDVHYLDLGAEGKGYIYVLSYAADGRAASDYQMDIYTPDGTFLARTSGVAAARLAVNLNRSVYTLNFETIFGTAGRPEPSLSLWIPSAPQP